MLFIFDENYSPKISEALKILESGNLKSPISVTVEHITNLIQRGAPDEDVVKIAGQKKGIIFTKDKDFKTIKALRNVFKEHKAGIALFKQSKKGLSYWENVKVLIEYWEQIKATLADQTPPFIFEIGPKGISRLEF